MFDHVTIRAADRGASADFYATVLREIGTELTHSSEYLAEWDDFSIAQATAGRPPTRRLHVAFKAPSRSHVDAFWQAGVDAGHASDGEPGPRPQYTPDYYGAFLLDPDGNSAEAVHQDDLRAGGNVDHLWIRVADLEAAGAFYDTIAPHAGLQRGSESPSRRQYLGASSTFSLIFDGTPPTEHLHIAFPASDRATVDAFHAAALAAGYRDNGPPGERPQYHPGYYGAFVLDPDGTNVEVVFHDRG